MADKIDDLFDFSAIDKAFNDQLDKYADQLKKFPPVKLSVEGAETVKALSKANEDFVKSMKEIEALQQQVAASQAKMMELEKKYAAEREKSTRANDDYNDSAKETIADNEKIKASYNSLGKSLDENIKRQLGLKSATETLKKEQKELQAAIDIFQKAGKNPGNIEEMNKLIAKQVEVTKSMEGIKQESTELQRTIRLQQKENNSLTGSLDEMKATYDRLFQSFRGLSEEERDSEFGKGMSANLDALKTKINEIQKGAGDFSANIGRYAGSLAKPFEMLQNKLSELKGNIATGTNSKTGGPLDPGAVTQTTLAINALEGSLSKSQAAGATTTTQMRALTEAYVALGNIDDTITGSVFLDELGDSIGEAKDAVADFKSELAIKASDTQGIDNVVGSLNVLVGAAQGAAGAYVLLGGSQEDAAVITSKLMALQGIANSVQQVGTEITRRGSAAYKIYTSVQQVFAVAMDRSAAASLRLAAATKILLGGAIIAAIAFLVIKITEAVTATSALQDTMKEYAEGAKEAILQTNKVKVAFIGAKDGVVSKDSALKTYNETLGDAFGKAKTLAEAEDLYNSKAGVYIQIMGLKAQANALFAKSADEAAKGIVANVSDQTGTFDKLKIGFLSYFGASSKAIDVAQKAQASGVAKVKRESKLAADQLFSDGLRIAEQADALGNKFKIKTEKPTTDKKATEKKQDLKDTTAAEILRAEFEIIKLRLKQEIDGNKEIIDNENFAFEQRLDALREFSVNSLALIDLEKQYAIDSENSKLKETLADLGKQKKEKGANVKAIGEIEKNEKLASAARILLIDAQYKDAIVKLTKDHVAKLRAIEKDANVIPELQGLDKVKKYYEEKERIARESAEKIKAQEIQNEKDIVDAKKQLQDEARDVFFSIISNGFQREIGQLDERKRILDEDTARRINQINLLGLTEVERTRQIAIVEKNAMAETEKIEKRKRQLAIDQAKFEKASAVAAILQNTSRGITAALATVPPNPILAGIIGAIGALQLAKVLTTPIPKFAKGTMNAPKGPAIVSEEGSEMVIEKSGRIYLTPSSPTLAQLAGGEKIIPHDITKDILQANNMQHLIAMQLKQNRPIEGNRINEQMLNELRSLNKKSRIVIHNERDIKSTAFYNFLKN